MLGSAVTWRTYLNTFRYTAIVWAVTVVLGFTVNSGQPKAGVAESLAAADFAQARIVDRPKLFCAIASKPTEPVGRETRGRGD